MPLDRASFKHDPASERCFLDMRAKVYAECLFSAILAPLRSSTAKQYSVTVRAGVPVGNTLHMQVRRGVVERPW